jgi:hypothetical protein
MEATIQYPEEIQVFLSNFSVRSDSSEVFFQNKETGNSIEISELQKFQGRRDTFFRLNEKTVYFQTENAFNTPINQRISIENIEIKKILSFQPEENECLDDRFIFVISFQQATIINSITEAFKDQVKVIESCSLTEINKVIKEIMESDENMNRFSHVDVKFDAYFYNQSMRELNGLCSVSGQEVWFTIRCFKSN